MVSCPSKLQRPNRPDSSNSKRLDIQPADLFPPLIPADMEKYLTPHTGRLALRLVWWCLFLFPTTGAGVMNSSSSSPKTPLVSNFANDPDMQDLVELFIDELPERIQSLRESFEQQQFDELKRFAHQIKGAGGGYGYPVLTIAARQLEQAVANNLEIESISKSLNELISLCERACLAA